MRNFMIIVLLILSLLLVACGGGGEAGTGGEEAEPVGDAAHGEELYKQPTIGSAGAPGCNTCHSLEPDTVLVGPSHANIATKAETVVDGLSAEEYLRQSILEPNAHVTEGFTEGIMYQNYADELSDQEVDDLVAFLLTQK